jgi:predicted  nucleic acid-binding Zn-ribbon protein
VDGTDTQPATEQESPPGPVTNPLRILLDVQAQDLELERIAYREREHPERATLNELDRLRAGLDQQLATLEAERTELAGRQAEIETHVQAFVSRSSAIDARLRSASAGSFRDQQAMATEKESLDHQRRDLEDREIDIMEQLEPLESEIAAFVAQRDGLLQQREAIVATLGTAVADLGADRAVVVAERQRLAALLPADLAATYERLRSKLGGIGAAKLMDGTCSGCHLKLPARERDTVVHALAGTVFYCEQCGRILVP